MYPSEIVVSVSHSFLNQPRMFQPSRFGERAEHDDHERPNSQRFQRKRFTQAPPPWQFFHLRPEPQVHGSLRPRLASSAA